jgi:hypothetical protein
MPLNFDSDEFQAWRDHPITQAFMAFLEDEATLTKSRWLNAAWDGSLNPIQHAAHRGGVEAINQILTLTWEDISNASNE